MDEEDQIMKAMRDAGFDNKTIRELTYTSWKDGIDIDRPTSAVMRFVELVKHR